MPEWHARIRDKVAAAGLPPADEAEVIDELAHHLDDRYRDLLAGGMTPAAAEQAALQEVPDHAPVARDLRRERRRPRPRVIRDAIHEWRIAARTLARHPRFAIAAVITLGLGLGAAGATFAVVDALLLRPLTYPAADRLVFISGVLPGDSGPGASVSYVDVKSLSERSTTMEGIAAYADSRALEFRNGDGAYPVRASFVMSPYLTTLGATARQGRLLTADDDRAPGARPVAVVSHDFWQHQLEGRADVIGTPITLSDESYVVVGVTAEGFRDISFETGEPPSDVWLPITMGGNVYGPTFVTSAAGRITWAVGRLRDGASVEQARAEAAAVALELERERPDTNRRIGFWVDRLDLWLFRDVRQPLLIVLLGAVLLLLVAALNVGGLMLIRLTERTRDLTVRRALGASGWRLIWPGIAEAMVIGAAAVAWGLMVTMAALAAVRSAAPYDFPRLLETSLDLRIMAVVVGLGGMAVVVMGLASVLVGRRAATLRLSSTRSTTGGQAIVRVQRWVVGGEIALAVVLLTGGVLTVASFRSHVDEPMGFDTANLLTTSLELRGERYRADPSVVAFSHALLDEVRAVPGVEAATVWGPGRPGRNTWISYPLPERDIAKSDPDQVMVWRHNIGAGALAQVGIPVIRGREFTATDVSASPFVVVVSQSMVDRFWPDQDPIGQRFTVVSNNPNRPWYQIIGVAADSHQRHRQYRHALRAYDFYQFYDQRPERSLTLVTRLASSNDDVRQRVREAIGRADAGLPIRDMRTVDDHLREESATLRFVSGLVTAFAGLAFALAAGGIYVLVGYLVALRAREFALRAALGASPSRLAGGIVGRSLRTALVGTFVGLAAAFAGAQAATSLLVGVNTQSPFAYAATAVIVLAATATAAAIPAWRVRSLDPARVLQSE